MNKNLIEGAQALILDFDGTLVDSNSIKIKAFEKCFADQPKHFSAIMDYCQNNHHTPRQVKFRYVFKNILQAPYTPKIEKHLLKTYAEETTEKVIQAKEIPGARDFLEKFYLAKELALLSSTPHDILLHILERRGMKKYFKTVRGAPVNKAEWIQNFLAKRRLNKVDVLFLGDSEEDARSARKAGVAFIGISPENSLTYFSPLIIAK